MIYLNHDFCGLIVFYGRNANFTVFMVSACSCIVEGTAPSQELVICFKSRLKFFSCFQACWLKEQFFLPWHLYNDAFSFNAG